MPGVEAKMDDKEGDSGVQRQPCASTIVGAVGCRA